MLTFRITSEAATLTLENSSPSPLAKDLALVPRDCEHCVWARPYGADKERSRSKPSGYLHQCLIHSFFKYSLQLDLLYICAHMHEGIHVTAHGWRPGDNLQESVLSSATWVPGTEPRPSGVVMSPLHPLCHLDGSQMARSFHVHLESLKPQSSVGNVTEMESLPS